MSYPLRVNKRADHSFEFVYSDIWGLAPKSTTLSFQYFIIFVDDFSLMMWLYLMKHLLETFYFSNFLVSTIKLKISLVSIFILCILIMQKNFSVHLL